ncbi:MAG: hypothetical protein JKX72_01355 [Robiginitomaculum sp.]|nr:hypothetical protein [Robiginitomaculum sp.]
MAKDPEILNAILSLGKDIGDIKGDMGEVKASVITLLKHKSDQEKRVRILEYNAYAKKGAIALFVFVLGSAASWLGLHFGGK